MIQPATVPASAKLLLAIDSQAANGSATGLDAQFSALLAANFTTPEEPAPGQAEGAPASELPIKLQLRPATGNTGGKAGGKFLPDSPVLAAFAAMLKDLRGASESKGDEITTIADETASAPAISADGQTDQAFAPALAADPVSAQGTPAPVIAQALPLPVAEPDQLASHQPPATHRSAVPEQIALSPAAFTNANVSMPQGYALAELASPAPAIPASPNPASPDSSAQELPQASPETQPLVIQSGLTTRVLLVPRSQPHLGELAKLQDMSIEQAKVGEAGAQIAKVQVLQMLDDRPEIHAARTASTLSSATMPTSTVAPEPEGARSAAAATADTPQETPRALLDQPAAASLFAGDTPAASGASPTGPISSAPAAAPSRTPDFAALIDRLVEARAAAQATLEPHTVNAAIQHADFGEVSLQFRHDAAGLSVVMASADPDLAKALQVAAPGGGSFAGQFANGGEGQTPQWRQDGSGQQSALTGQAQSQSSQHRGQSSQRQPEQGFSAANPAPRSRSQTDQAARSGIFA